MPTPELPQLREQLVDAAAQVPRRRRRARLTAAAGTVTVIVLGTILAVVAGRGVRPKSELEGLAATMTPSPGKARTLEAGYAVLRRPPTPADDIGATVASVAGPPGSRVERTRFVGSAGRTRAYLVQLANPSRLCLRVVTGPQSGGTACSTPARALDPLRTPSQLIVNTGGPKTIIRIFPDTVARVKLLVPGRPQRDIAVVDNAVVERVDAKTFELRWEDQGGTPGREDAGLPGVIDHAVRGPTAKQRDQRLLVSNGGAPDGTATAYAARLRAAGWQTEVTNLADRTIDATAIVSRADDSDAARAVSSRLHIGTTGEATRDQARLLGPDAPVMIVLGADA